MDHDHSPTELSEVKSSAYPKLERVPGKQNWVDHAGGLPKYIERIAKHLHYEKGFPIGTAIAIAVNTVKRWASAGTVTKKGGHQVTAKTRAQAAKAVAEWEAKKKAGSAAMKVKEAAVEIDADTEAELLEAVSDEPYDLTEDAAKYLTRNFSHPKKMAEQLAAATMRGEDGPVMSPEERTSVAARFENRLNLLEGVALSLDGDDKRAQSLAVANGYQLLNPGAKPVKLNEVPPSASEAEVRALFAQMTPEMLGLREAVATLRGVTEADTTADYPNLMSGRKCEKCGHSISKHDKDGKCDDCAKDKAYRAYEMQEAKKGKKCGCWDGYCRVPGTKPCAPGSCKKCDAHRIKGELSEAMRGQRAKGALPKENPDALPPQDEISAEAKENADATTERVKHLQSRLDSLGFETKVDGKFGPKTHERVREFQMHSGLVQDGVVGPNTTSALRLAPAPEDMSIAIAAQPGLVPQATTPAPEAINPKDAQDAARPTGDSTGSEKETKAKVEEGLADGFGSETEMGPTLMPDDLNLMNPVQPIEVATGIAAEQQKLPKPKPWGPMMYKGVGVGAARANKNVRALQGDLRKVGYNVAEDGRFGPETDRAIKRFQRKYGLNPDGVAGPKTLRTLTGVRNHLAKIDEALMDQDLAVDAPEWQEAHDRLVGLKRELVEAEKGGEQAWPELEEAVTRGAAREIAAKLKRLPDGTFAPKGMGQVLTPGDKVEVPTTSGAAKGVVKAGGRVEIPVQDGKAVVGVKLADGAYESDGAKGTGKKFQPYDVIPDAQWFDNVGVGTTIESKDSAGVFSYTKEENGLWSSSEAKDLGGFASGEDLADGEKWTVTKEGPWKTKESPGVPQVPPMDGMTPLGAKEPAEWAEAKKKYPNDPVFPSGKPYSVRIKELTDEGMTQQDAQDVADAEVSDAGLFPDALGTKPMTTDEIKRQAAAADPEFETDPEDLPGGEPMSPGTLNLSNAGPSGKPRNVKAMGDDKLEALSGHPDVDPELKKRVDAELKARGKVEIKSTEISLKDGTSKEGPSEFVDKVEPSADVATPDDVEKAIKDNIEKPEGVAKSNSIVLGDAKKALEGNDTDIPDEEILAVQVAAGSSYKVPLGDLPVGTNVVLNDKPEQYKDAGIVNVIGPAGGGSEIDGVTVGNGAPDGPKGAIWTVTGVVSVNDKGKKVVHVNLGGDQTEPFPIKANQNRKFTVYSHPNIEIGATDPSGNTKASNFFIPDSELDPNYTVKAMEADGRILGLPVSPSKDTPAGDESPESPAGDESALVDNIGPDAKSVKDLTQGQKLMLPNGEEYTYHKQANENSPFHIIKPIGWTEDNDLKAKPMHGELVPPKIGLAPGEGEGGVNDNTEVDDTAETPDQAKIDAALEKYTEIKDGTDYTPANKAKLDALWAEMIGEVEKEDPAIWMQMESVAPHTEPGSPWEDIEAEEKPANKALEVYLAAGGKDESVIKALSVAEAAGWSFEEALSLVESIIT